MRVFPRISAIFFVTAPTKKRSSHIIAWLLPFVSGGFFSRQTSSISLRLVVITAVGIVGVSASTATVVTTTVVGAATIVAA